jgi:hypothetical protein
VVVEECSLLWWRANCFGVGGAWWLWVVVTVMFSAKVWWCGADVGRVMVAFKPHSLPLLSFVSVVCWFRFCFVGSGCLGVAFQSL